MAVLASVTALLAACTGPQSGASSDSGPGNSAAGRAASAPRASGERTPRAVSSLVPALILTGHESVVVSSVDRCAARAESIAATVGGRTDADDQNSPRGFRPSARLTLRVPNASVPTVLNRLAALGRETDRHLSTRDVTTQVADVTSRVASARAAITSLRALYRRATTVGDVLRIGATLSQREASLESLQARQRALTGEVALATITVDLTQRPAPAVTTRTPRRGGFVGGLDHGWDAFTATAGAVAVGIGAALPFLLVLAVLLAIGLVVRRRVRQ